MVVILWALSLIEAGESSGLWHVWLLFLLCFFQLYR